MALDWRDSLDDLDWEELSTLYRLAPLGDKKPEALRIAFGNSMFRCLVRDKGRLVGAGRAVADGVDCSYICDVAVHPSHQGAGLGRAIVSKLVELSSAHKKIILYANPGTEPFYRRLGFQRMSTAMAIFQNREEAMQRGLVSDE
jgi:ribosomal protein S18 acetylase RimI-like enzyme